MAHDDSNYSVRDSILPKKAEKYEIHEIMNTAVIRLH